MTSTCTICLTCDVDAFSPAVFRGDADAATLSQGEFDTRVAVPRLIELFADLAVPATFFVPGHTALCFPEEVQAIAVAGHEVGHHGHVHEPPAEVTGEEEEAALDRGLEALADVLGVRPVGYRAPMWLPSVRTIGLLESRNFEYDSSLMATDVLPYWARAGDEVSAEGARWGRRSTIVEVPGSWTFDDWGYFANVLRPGGGGQAPPSHVREIWSEVVEHARESVADPVVVFTFHPQVSGQGHVLRMLRRLLEPLVDAPDVHFSSLVDAAASWRARQDVALPATSTD